MDSVAGTICRHALVLASEHGGLDVVRIRYGESGPPRFITIKPTQWQGGDKLFATSFLPGAFQGTPVGSAPMSVDDIIDNPIDHVLPRSGTADEQRLELEFLRHMNRRHADERRLDPDLEARIQAFGLAFRMQAEAPTAFDVSLETEATRKLYGMEDEVTRELRLAVPANASAQRARRAGGASHALGNRGEMGPPRGHPAAPPHPVQRGRQAHREIDQGPQGPRIAGRDP